MSSNVTVVGVPRVGRNQRFSPSDATAPTPPNMGTNNDPRPSTVAVIRGPSVGNRVHHRLRPSSAERENRLQPRSEIVAWNDEPMPSEEATPIAGAPNVRDHSNSGACDTEAWARPELGGPPVTDDQLAACGRRASPLSVWEVQPARNATARAATPSARATRGVVAGPTDPPSSALPW